MSNVTPIPQPKAPLSAASPSSDAVQSTVTDQVRAAQRKRVTKLALRLGLWVLLPTLLSAVYYGFIAPNEFESTAVVALAKDSEVGNRGLLLAEYLASRDALQVLEERVELSEHYISGRDPLFGLSENAGSEARFQAFLQRTSVRHDARTGVVRIKARAYDPTNAKRVTQAMLDAGGEFIAQVDKGSERPLVVIAKPSRPSDATYPQRGYGILTTFLAALAIYSVGSLLIAAMREHAHF